MKIEFHPDFNFRIDFKVIWPRLKGFLKNFSLKADRYPRTTRLPALMIAAGLAVIILIVAVLLLIISA